MTKSRVVTIDSEADPLLNASCSALHLPYEPKDELIQQIVPVSIQESIKRSSNDGLFCCPPPSLHMTILTIIPSRPQLAAHTGAARVSAESRWTRIIARVFSTRSPFNMQFDTVEVSNRAIFLKGRQAAELQSLRSALVKQLAPVGLRLVAPDIAHVSLFRFTRTAPNLPDWKSRPRCLKTCRRRMCERSFWQKNCATLRLSASASRVFDLGVN
jgi:hypothetical protein